MLDGRVKLNDLPHTDLDWSDRLADSKQLVVAGKYEEAVKAYEDFLRNTMAPNDKIAAAYYNIGVIQIGLVQKVKGIKVDPESIDLDGAETNFTQAIHYFPKMAPAYLQRASIFTAKNQYDAALKDCSAAMKYEKDPEERKRIRELRQIIHEQTSSPLEGV